MATEKTPAQVARHATVSAPLNTRAPMLLGTYGSDDDRQALVRLPHGAVETLGLGDVLGGARVVAIAEDHIALAEAGTDATHARKLHMPGTGKNSAEISGGAIPGLDHGDK